MAGTRKQYEGKRPSFMSEDWFKEREQDVEGQKPPKTGQKLEKQPKKKK